MRFFKRMQSKENPPRHEIFITPLAAYGANQDTGRWILATKNEDELKERITQVLKDCPYSTTGSDWRVSDYQGFYGYGVSLGEHPSLKDIAQTIELMESYGELAVKLIRYFCGDVEEAVRHLNDKYLGVFDSLADYAEENVKSQISGDIPVLIADYIDYVAMARDWLLGGEIFTIITVDETNKDKSQVHIFSNRPTS